MSQRHDLHSARGEACHTLGALLALSTYVALHACHAPLFVYLPVERAFVLSAPQGALGMGLFGYMAGALLGYGGGLALGRLRWFQRPDRLAGARAALLVATVLALGYFVVAELMHASGAS